MLLAAALAVSSAAVARAQEPFAQPPVDAPATPTPVDAAANPAQDAESNAATNAPAPDAARFIIEKIVVVGVRRGATGVVASETLLTPGSAYSERQLREALQRVERLPFVVSAEFSLRRGTGRGRFELVVSVVEMKAVFLGATLGVTLSTGSPWDGWAFRISPELGGRVFFGQSSELSATVGAHGVVSGDGGDGIRVYRLTYRHHNLFGRHVVGSLSVGGFGSSSPGIDGELAVPVNRTGVVSLHLTRSRSESNTGTPSTMHFWSNRQTSSVTDLRWRRDTTDDPFAPRRGSRLEAAGLWNSSDQSIASSSDPWQASVWYAGQPLQSWTASTRGRGPGGSATAERYWPLGASLAVGLSTSFSTSRFNFKGDTFQDGALARRTIQENTAVSGTAGLELVGLFDRKRCGVEQCWWSFRTSLTASRNRQTWDPPRAVWTGLGEEPALRTRGEQRTTNLATVLGLGMRGRRGSVRLELSYIHSFRQDYDNR